MPEAERTQAFPYQVKGVDRIQDFGGRALLADEMGLGKTFQVLLWAWMYLDDTDLKIVVCPASIKWNWQREARKHIGQRAEVLEGRKPPKGFTFRPKTIYILNYDILGNPEHSGTWAHLIRRSNPALVVFDECHYLKSRDSQRTRFSRAMVAKVPHVIGVSGTPLTSRPAELWPILNVLMPKHKLFKSFTRYANRYCKPEWTRWGVKYTGAQRLDELHKILKNRCMIRRLKKDVLKELPPKTRVVVPLDLERMSEYIKAENDFVKWLTQTHPQKANRARNAERLVKAGYLRRLVGELKLKAVENWIKDHFADTDGKLITFGVHKTVVKGLHGRFAEQSVVVDGSVTGHKRQEAIDRFNSVSSCRMFVGNIHAAGVGWNGQIADTVAFAELDYVPANMIQAEDRIHRMGQKKRTTCYYLIGKGTIEEKVMEILQSKQQVSDEVLDGEAGIQEYGILDQLEEALVGQGSKLKKRK